MTHWSAGAGVPDGKGLQKERVRKTENCAIRPAVGVIPGAAIVPARRRGMRNYYVQ